MDLLVTKCNHRQFNFIKILSLKEFSTEGFKQGSKQLLPTKATKISTAIFFLIHYGFFHLIYAVFLSSFSIFGYFSKSEFEMNYFLFSTAMFFISSLIEFNSSKKETVGELPNIGKLMFAPYLRIIPMHLTIILGGFIAAAGSSFSVDTNLTIIVLFIGIKTIIDLITESVSNAKLKSQTKMNSD